MIQYPKGQQRVSSPQTSTVSYGSRGMFLETLLNQTNDYYRLRKIAVIHKKPTPVQIVKVDYPKRSRAKIVEAYFRQASTTDYSGVYRGHYIDFEAKETRQKQSMPMKNFHAHQIEHMDQVLNQGGICFVLLHFSSLKETYLLPAPYLIEFYKIDKGGKSMPLDYIQKHGYLIEQNILPSIPYLDIISKNLLGGHSNE